MCAGSRLTIPLPEEKPGDFRPIVFPRCCPLSIVTGRGHIFEDRSFALGKARLGSPHRRGGPLCLMSTSGAAPHSANTDGVRLDSIEGQLVGDPSVPCQGWAWARSILACSAGRGGAVGMRTAWAGDLVAAARRRHEAWTVRRISYICWRLEPTSLQA